MTKVRFTKLSSNRKVGKMSVTTTERQSCPDACPFKGNGCYADGFPLAGVWNRVPEEGHDWDTLCDMVEHQATDVWRHNQAGDCPKDSDNPEWIDAKKMSQLVHANKRGNKKGMTYTHYSMAHGRNRQVVGDANKNGFTINLSANSLSHADDLADLDIAPVTTVLPVDQMANTTTPKGRKVVVCPAVIRDDVSCMTCKLCWKQRDAIVGFPAHGNSKRKAEGVVNNAS